MWVCRCVEYFPLVLRWKTKRRTRPTSCGNLGVSNPRGKQQQQPTLGGNHGNPKKNRGGGGGGWGSKLQEEKRGASPSANTAIPPLPLQLSALPELSEALLPQQHGVLASQVAGSLVKTSTVARLLTLLKVNNILVV